MQLHAAEFLQCLAEPAFFIDHEYRISIANELACQLTGFSLDELRAMQFLDLIADTREMERIFTFSEVSRQVKGVHVSLKTKSEATVPVRISTGRTTFANESENGFLVICFERHQEIVYGYYVGLLDHETARHHISSRLAHKIGNSLEVIKNFSFILGQELKNEHQNHYLEFIQEEVNKISSLVQSEHSSVSSEGISRDMVLIDSFLEDLLSLVRPWTISRHIHFESIKGHCQASFYANHELLLKCLVFLIISELEIMTPGGNLKIETSQTDHFTCFTLLDSITNTQHSFDSMSIVRAKDKYSMRMATIAQLALSFGATLTGETLPGIGRKIVITVPGEREE